MNQTETTNPQQAIPDGLNSSELISWHMDEIKRLIDIRRKEQYAILEAAGKTEDEIIDGYQLDNVLIFGTKIVDHDRLKDNIDGVNKCEAFGIMAGWGGHLKQSVVRLCENDKHLDKLMADAIRERAMDRIRGGVLNMLFEGLDKEMKNREAAQSEQENGKEEQ